MGSFGWGSFYPCEYCEYQVENAYLFDADINGGCFALCAWCWDYCIDKHGEPNGPDHWWATWRWEANRVETEWKELPPEACEMVASFLVHWCWSDSCRHRRT